MNEITQFLGDNFWKLLAVVCIFGAWRGIHKANRN